jgi:ribonuclease BN (tRNA processing enzyme)
VRIRSWAACAVLLAGAALPGPARAADSTVVVLLGTGTPRPDPSASGPATAIVVGTRVFLVDAGAGVERQLAAAHLPVDGVTALFVTHLHSDHTLGYPDLVLTSWVMGRHRPLQVFGPRGLAAMTDHLVAAWVDDIRIRTEGLEHQRPEGYRVAVHEVAPGVVYDSAGVRVTAIAVQHGSWPEAFGYRFDAPDRSIVVSGDTRPCEGLARAAQGVDVLVHEVYPASRMEPNETESSDWPAYLRTFHTSDVELGALAARARPRLVILTHIIRRGASDGELLAAVRRGGYGGRVVVGHDLDRY